MSSTPAARRLRSADRGTRSILFSAVVTAIVVIGLVVAPRAGAVTTSEVRLANGVVLYRQVFTSVEGHAEHAVLMNVDLGVRGVHIAPASPAQLVGAPRATVPTMADATHALGGVNGDWFDMRSYTAPPRGALIRPGAVLKTPRPAWAANFFIRADGTAGIGRIPFSGTVTRTARTGPAAPSSSFRIFSVNTVADARAGRITLINAGLARIAPGFGCTAAFGYNTSTGARRISGSETGATSIPRLAPGRWALLACGGTGATWLLGQVRAGDSMAFTLSYGAGLPRAAISGGRILVAGGRAYDDVGGQQLRPDQNPMTFVCVSRYGRTVLLGVVDGRSYRSVGMDYYELTHYLLALHCWTGMTLDGGGSTTMTARLPGHSTNTVLNVPSNNSARPIVDGLFVYTR
ncbi:MAG TPA: phosphodiester glycosidase family protein [Jatrophihabitans sp.]|uniref:phosphodiester glycosidase family protein n=1 Tax=Jatrophihabitans sp. TaxID=1932789 RepID=UPI002DFFBC9C|nr:phosphodiester glycosidase family protein [Jatrophihabitans sp.]